MLELPTFHRYRSTIYDVMLDDKPLTWSIWDTHGWVGDIHTEDLSAEDVGIDDVPPIDDWYSLSDIGRATGPHRSWRQAIDAMIDDRPDLPADAI